MDLVNLKTKQDLKRIIIEELGYPASGDQPFPLQIDEENRSKIATAQIIAAHGGFGVVFVQFNSDKNENGDKFDLRMRGLERMIISKIDKHLRQQYLFIFASSDREYWHFVNALPTAQVNLRRFSINPDNRSKLRTMTEQLSKIKIDSADNLQSIIDKHQKAFDVEEVTTKFFKQFAEYFSQLMDLISNIKKGIDQKEISDIAQIILNRLIFLKFIEKKGWLDGDKDYLYNKFQKYYDGGLLYWNEIVCPLFDLLSASHKNPDKNLGSIPFLNGGLFGYEPKDLWTLAIPNEYFQSLFENIFNRFNFTIEESSPTSVEVAVDPEMLGRIFETLILTLEKSKDFQKDLRRATGSYYTPRVVVFHMVRSAIAKSLSQKTGLSENSIKELIDFAVDEVPDEKQTKDCHFNKTEVRALIESIENLSICDPGVGSGAFLLMSLQILVGLIRFLSLSLSGATEDDYNLKEKVISHNLIGVDILKQAVHICELRLWLSLAVDYQNNDINNLPTLPNLTYKIFRGDSIIDHVQGHHIDYLENLRTENFTLNVAMKQNLENLKLLKNKYFREKDEKEKIRLREQIESKKLEMAIGILEQEHKETSGEQAKWLPDASTQLKFILEEIGRIEKQGRKELIERLKKILENKTFHEISDRLDFVWKIDLVEYFIDQRDSGFDIVIGNPPYGLSMKLGKERYGLGSDDSYGVFIAMAIKDLLKHDGVLSFITSNTWQTIKSHKLLRRLILDNTQVHELLMVPDWVFVSAVVNTSILLLTKHEGRVGFGNKTTGAEERNENTLLACDFTRAERYTAELDEYLYSLDNPKFYSNAKAAFYGYKQGLIETNSNWPFFAGSPKLFALINENIKNSVYSKLDNSIEGIFGGIKSYDNKEYIRSTNGEDGYEIVDSQLILKRELTDVEKREGIDRRDHSIPYYLEFEKGGETLKIKGCFNNYYHSVNFFFPWDTNTVKKLSKINALRNKDRYFGEGIGVTAAGIYSPLFRYVKLQLFQNGFQAMSLKKGTNKSVLLGILCSKFTRYIFKNFINHSVNSNAQDIIELPIANGQEYEIKISNITNDIIEQLKKDDKYNFDIEQKEIDKLVYEMYGLNTDDIREVETWYARRYPKLARFCNISKEVLK